MARIDQYTDEELAQIAQLDLRAVGAGQVPVTADTPVMVLDEATGLATVVTIGELGTDMVRRAHSPGLLGKPAGAVLAQRGLDLLAAAGVTCGVAAGDK
jgi:hypothetical protein